MPTTIYARTDGTMFRSTDSLNWSQIASPTTNVSHLFNDGTKWWVSDHKFSSVFDGANRGRMWYSTNAGGSWTQLPIHEAYPLMSAHLRYASNGTGAVAFVAQDGKLYYSNDSGTTWQTPVTLPFDVLSVLRFYHMNGTWVITTDGWQGYYDNSHAGYPIGQRKTDTGTSVPAKVWYSTDLISWASNSGPTTLDAIRDIAWNGTYWIISAHTGGNVHRLYKSTSLAGTFELCTYGSGTAYNGGTGIWWDSTNSRLLAVGGSIGVQSIAGAAMTNAPTTLGNTSGLNWSDIKGKVLTGKSGSGSTVGLWKLDAADNVTIHDLNAGTYDYQGTVRGIQLFPQKDGSITFECNYDPSNNNTGVARTYRVLADGTVSVLTASHQQWTAGLDCESQSVVNPGGAIWISANFDKRYRSTNSTSTWEAQWNGWNYFAYFCYHNGYYYVMSWSQSDGSTLTVPKIYRFSDLNVLKQPTEYWVRTPYCDPPPESYYATLPPTGRMVSRSGTLVMQASGWNPLPQHYLNGSLVWTAVPAAPAGVGNNYAISEAADRTVGIDVTNNRYYYRDGIGAWSAAQMVPIGAGGLNYYAKGIAFDGTRFIIMA
ncbi:hypothetical protein FBZ85_10249 [Azospirillum brasilense]|nr:hypothetical protein [Azospirillum baldaniorum]TWA81675.1 hypothetical protein FBZ85_10249 [Azospirillum brasilense]